MYKILTFLFFFFSANVFGQNNPTDDAQPIVAEGKLLYESEMASWYGTDLFLENYKDKENIGGYFSYAEKDSAKCVFFSKKDEPRVIGTITFDKSYDLKKADINLSERSFSKNENDLFEIRKVALLEINSDTLFKTYTRTSLNIIPLISGQEKKVYVLTGTQDHGVVIFGNDYLLTFDSENKVLMKKSLHRNIIPVHYDKTENPDEPVFGSAHSHLPETGEYITATDICTLMLYSKFAKWNQHMVISEKFMNIWNCNTNELTVIPRDRFESDQGTNKGNRKKRKKKVQ